MGLLVTETYINKDYPIEGSIEVVLLSTEGCFVIPVPTLVSETIHLESAIDSFVIPFTEQIIEDAISNSGSFTLYQVEVVGLPGSGFLYLDGVQVEQSIIFPYIDIDKLKYIAVKPGYGVGDTKLKFKPIPDPVSSWSAELTVIFDILRSNELPTVDNNTVIIDYMTSHIITLDDLLYNYQDLENDAFVRIEINSYIGSGTLKLDGVSITAFPQVVTKQEIIDEKLVYDDPGTVTSPKDFDIEYTVYDY